jgi:hypothetical protein
VLRTDSLSVRGGSIDASDVALASPSWFEGLSLGRTSSSGLAAVAVVPALCGVWLLLAPDVVLSREMTWDLLFNLAGAWHLANGHVLHVDVYTPFGPLTFWPTLLGFQIVGATPVAFLVGQIAVLAGVFALAVPAAARRLPPLPAAIFVIYLVLLVLLPANVGDAPNAYSFAMSYNRWGWAVLAIVCLILFVAPRRTPATPWLDLSFTGLSIACLFLLKVTFAAAALAAVLLAVILVRHVRERARDWLALLAVAVGAMVPPVHEAYYGDLFRAEVERIDLTAHLNTIVANRSEFAVYAMIVLALAWLWQRGWTRFEAVASAVVLTGLGLAVLTQNAQVGDVPLGIVISLIGYTAVADAWRRHPAATTSELRILVMLALVGPLFSIGAAAKVLVGYYSAAMRTDALLTVSTTNLRGLAVPAHDHDVPRVLAAAGHVLEGSHRDPPLRDPIAQSEYVRSLVEAAELLAHQPVRVLVLDQVNPLPFMLGYPPPRGGHLWLTAEVSPLAADALLGDVDVVLVPKYSTFPSVTAYGLSTYGADLARRFPSRRETPHWTVLRR